MNDALSLENEVVLAGVQAFVGAITPTMAAISVEVDAANAAATVYVALRTADRSAGTLLEDVADDINILSEDAVTVRVSTWVGEDWTRDWPGRDKRMLYAARRT